MLERAKIKPINPVTDDETMVAMKSNLGTPWEKLKVIARYYLNKSIFYKMFVMSNEIPLASTVLLTNFLSAICHKN